MAIKVLVVEDNELTLELLSQVITSSGAEVKAMTDSREAATLVNQENFDSIFLDLMMPGMDGFELARQIRRSSQNKSTPIIIVTALLGSAAMAQAYEAGATFFINKPLDKSRLNSLLKTVSSTMFEGSHRSERIPLHTEVTYKAGPLTMVGTSFTLSSDDILFQSFGPMKIGSTVWLSFHLPEQESPVEVSGVVIYFDEEKKTGIRFTQITQKARERIRNFVAEQVAASGAQPSSE